MSGIAGIFRIDGADSRESDVLKMMDAMPHRGPDGRGCWAEGASALGHLLLRTTPESVNEVQPLALNGCVLVADARIDNRSELVSSLDLSSDATDSDLILHSYLKWGDDCLQHLIGDFAFAISDRRNNRLFCARDHFGLRPFYYHHLPGRRLALATEIKALLKVEGVSGAMNEQRLVDYLSSIRNDNQSTIYEGVLRLPPAHTLTVDREGIRIERYWRLEPADLSEFSTDEEYTRRFHELFREAVRCRTRSVGAIGTELSGGLDSTYVSCVARDEMQSMGGQDVHTFSVIYDESPECDEREYIHSVLEQGGFDAHMISGDQAGPLTYLDEVYGSVLDDFLVGGNYMLKWLIYRDAQDHDVRVILNGTDGDTVVQHGDLYLQELAEKGQWTELSRQIAALARVYQEADHAHPFQEDFASQWKLFNRYVLGRLRELAVERRYIELARGVNSVPGPFNVTRMFLLKRLWRDILPAGLQRRDKSGRSSHLELPKLVNQTTIDRFELEERLEQLRAEEGQLFASVREKTRVTLERARLTGGFEAANHIAAWFRTEPRYPFMDIRLVSFCMALPPRQSLADGWTRAIMRRAMAEVVPEKVRLRIGKGRLYEGFRHGLLKVDAKKLDYHVSNTGALATYTNTDYLNELLAHKDELGSMDLMLLTRAAILSNWLKIRFSANSVREKEMPGSKDKNDSSRIPPEPGDPNENIAILRT